MATCCGTCGSQMLYLEVDQLQGIGWGLKRYKLFAIRGLKDPESCGLESVFIEQDQLGRRSGFAAPTRTSSTSDSESAMWMEHTLVSSVVLRTRPKATMSGYNYTLRINGKRELCVLPLPN